ncbi:8391_t:CDS:2 [Diversispora eburnea]|uniref:8391_t:CDS:1 n=1 Tax=Diversispora eburnea TaxID=1213867 RepID=A0A9N9FWH0_9GLOM|nr:8391_t:CDS:2 [Diversispora eburnea]
MNLQLTTKQQQKLINIHQSFQPNPNVNIQFNPGTIKVKVNNYETTVVIPKTKTKKKPMSKYIEDAFDTEYELDQIVNNEENFDTLLRFIIDSSKSNDERITTNQIKRDIWNKIQRNGTCFLRIVQKSNKITEVVGEFLSQRFEHITFTWLSYNKNKEFENFLIKLKVKYKQDIELLAKAQE